MRAASAVPRPCAPMKIADASAPDWGANVGSGTQRHDERWLTSLEQSWLQSWTRAKPVDPGASAAQGDDPHARLTATCDDAARCVRPSAATTAFAITTTGDWTLPAALAVHAPSTTACSSMPASPDVTANVNTADHGRPVVAWTSTPATGCDRLLPAAPANVRSAATPMARIPARHQPPAATALHVAVTADAVQVAIRDAALPTQDALRLARRVAEQIGTAGVKALRVYVNGTALPAPTPAATTPSIIRQEEP